MIVISPRMLGWGYRLKVAGYRFGTARVVLPQPANCNFATCNHQTGGLPRSRTEFAPGKSRDFTGKVCNPAKVASAKAELNRRGEVCAASLTPGFRVAENGGRVGALRRPDAAARRPYQTKWTGMRIARRLFRFGRPACVSQHLCPTEWSPVRELHPPEWFCRPLPRLLGQRDVKVECGRKHSLPSALLVNFLVLVLELRFPCQASEARSLRACQAPACCLHSALP
jgi:hypothetical protein